MINNNNPHQQPFNPLPPSSLVQPSQFVSPPPPPPHQLTSSFHVPSGTTSSKKDAGTTKKKGRPSSKTSTSATTINQQPQIQAPSSSSSGMVASSSSASGEINEGEYSFDLPRTNVLRVIRRAIPEEIALSNDSKLAFAKAAVVFIMYLTATAQEEATKHKRSTLTADDVLDALDTLELGDYKEELVRTLHQYRLNQKAKKDKSTKRKKGDEADDM
ncbi:hypothetical protein C9374_002204 [Naegleria lovaniensis]|uniref:Transcription factor CBF/NF-Y/archaeal histone domain-containing protein n=1 Tax=Naegleria lovaniensis TaxID=51637 RepID=A0AA88GT94_NAELO|nr:uncharacterized protein C9374_002204 [Naegleria lovaniensis]KAG2386460.1 hypothetical protein C9374_002204 [Naegleria lovaniensis]